MLRRNVARGFARDLYHTMLRTGRNTGRYRYDGVWYIAQYRPLDGFVVVYEDTDWSATDYSFYPAQSWVL